MTLRAIITTEGRELAKRLSETQRALESARGTAGYLDARAQMWAAEEAYEAHARSMVPAHRARVSL